MIAAKSNLNIEYSSWKRSLKTAIKISNDASGLYARSKSACDRCMSSELLIHTKPRK